MLNFEHFWQCTYTWYVPPFRFINTPLLRSDHKYKIKHTIKLARLGVAQLSQSSLAFCFSLQPMTAYRPGLDGTPRHWLQDKMPMRAATVTWPTCNSCRTCFKFYCMFYCMLYFTYDLSFRDSMQVLATNSLCAGLDASRAVYIHQCDVVEDDSSRCYSSCVTDISWWMTESGWRSTPGWNRIESRNSFCGRNSRDAPRVRSPPPSSVIIYNSGLSRRPPLALGHRRPAAGYGSAGDRRWKVAGMWLGRQIASHRLASAAAGSVSESESSSAEFLS